jgi:hypothetical protein
MANIGRKCLASFLRTGKGWFVRCGELADRRGRSRGTERTLEGVTRRISADRRGGTARSVSLVEFEGDSFRHTNRSCWSLRDEYPHRRRQDFNRRRLYICICTRGTWLQRLIPSCSCRVPDGLTRLAGRGPGLENRSSGRIFFIGDVAEFDFGSRTDAHGRTQVGLLAW